MALKNNSLSLDNKLSNSALVAVYRQELQRCELNKVCETLEACKIPFMPLKGAVLREYYPEPWMRTSCDIDILVHENMVEQAAACLAAHCGYSCGDKGSHDISLFSQGKTHVELHYALLGNGLSYTTEEMLNAAWDYAVVREGYKYWYEMTDEMFYFYHILHMAKHFVLGGCGIRSLIDLWILDGLADREKKTRDELLEKGELLEFANAARALSGVWFKNEEYTEITRQMEYYILRGGVYGISENRIAIQQQRAGGQMKYALSRIFLPYNSIKFLYPVLQKKPWLTPFMEVHRWIRLLLGGKARASFRELRYSNRITTTEAEKTHVLLKSLGLCDKL